MAPEDLEKVDVEKVIFLNPHLSLNDRWKPEMERVSIPIGHKKWGVRKSEYELYRKGLESACADIVIVTKLPGGEAAVIASKRIIGKPFGGRWWMQGGAIHAYRSYEDFICERAHEECGIRPTVHGLIGIFRTCASDAVGSTTNVCFLGSVSFEELQKAKPDHDHTDQRLFTLKELENLSPEATHWYPMMTFQIALKTMQ